MRTLFTIAVAATILLTVLSLGMGLRVPQLVAAFRRGRLLAATAVVNLLVVPAAGWLLASALPLKPDQRIAVVLVACGAGGAAALKAVQISRRGDAALAIGLVVLLEPLNLISVPLWAATVVDDGSVSPTVVLANLVMLVLLPLALGLLLGARTPGLARTLVPWTTRSATVGVVVALAAGLGSADNLADQLRSWVPVAAMLTCVVGLALGWAITRRDPATRATVSMVTGTRFSALGLLVIATAFHDAPRYLSPAIVAALVYLGTPMIFAVLLSRRALPAQEPSVAFSARDLGSFRTDN